MILFWKSSFNLLFILALHIVMHEDQYETPSLLRENLMKNEFSSVAMQSKKYFL